MTQQPIFVLHPTKETPGRSLIRLYGLQGYSNKYVGRNRRRKLDPDHVINLYHRPEGDYLEHLRGQIEKWKAEQGNARARSRNWLNNLLTQDQGGRA